MKHKRHYENELIVCISCQGFNAYNDSVFNFYTTYVIFLFINHIMCNIITVNTTRRVYDK